ncbi:TPA: DUF6216 family protein [Enterobacter ludwigii]
MEDNGLLSELIYPLIVAIVGGVIPSFLQYKILPNGFRNTLSRELPNYVRSAGVNLFLYRISCGTIKIEDIQPISVIKKGIMLFFSLVIIVSIGCFTYYSFKIILNTPKGYANLTLPLTDEWFVISENDAMSYPDNDKWMLNQDVCHSKIYQEISKNIGASYQLVYMICTSVGLEKEKNGLKKRIDKFSKDRNVVVIINFIFIFYAIVLVLIICSPIVVIPKLIKYRERYLEKKFLVK